MLDADRPITSSKQDRLNRTEFAKNLARCMLDHQDADSLVIGLYGDYGVGKTSIINLTLEELSTAANNMLDEEKPIVLNFSPWSYAGQHQLIYSFFRRLSATLRQSTYLYQAEKIIALLELYISFFTKQPLPKLFSQDRGWFSSKETESIGWESGRDLTQVKAELNSLLKAQKHKIIIVIDNISRLYDDEIVQIFQMVKSIGDFANTVYLLSLDKKQVLAALDKLQTYGGEELLEKVVQLPFIVPSIAEQDLEFIFADKLSEVIPLLPEDAWDTSYWANLYYGSLRYLFKNCRDITRYVNLLQFSYPRVRDLVNPVDFFALTAIEIFFPPVYLGIRDNKDLFTDLLDNVYRLDEKEIIQDKLRCDEIIKRVSPDAENLLITLLMALFPRIKKIVQPDILFYHSDTIARKLKQICSPDLFDVYFRLSMELGQLSIVEFEAMLATAKNASDFDHVLTRLNQDDRIIKFLDMLDTNLIEKIPKDHIQNIVSALLDNGDYFPHGKASLLTLNTQMRIHRIIHQLLRKYDKSEDRFIILQHAIVNATKSIYSIIHELREQGKEHTPEADTYLPLEYRDLTPEQLNSLRQLAIVRIKNWAQNGSLATIPQLISILQAWMEWGDPRECQQYVLTITKTDGGLLAFLTGIFKSAIQQAMTEYIKSYLWEDNLQDIEIFIPAKDLEYHAKTLFEGEHFEQLKEEQQLALMIFLDLMKTDTKKTIPKTSV